MTVCSKSNEHRIRGNRNDNGLLIEKMVADDKVSYLEATTQFMEENSLPFNDFAKYLPQVVIDKIKMECIKDNVFRRGVVETPVVLDI